MGVAQGKGQRDIPPVAEPQNIRPQNPLTVHEAQQVLRKLINGKGRGPPWGLPVPPCIHGVDLPALGEVGNLAGKVVPALPIPMKQQQGMPLPPTGKMQTNIRHNNSLNVSYRIQAALAFSNKSPRQGFASADAK